MGRSQRQKGKRGEQATARELREAFPHIAHEVRRGWQSRAGNDEPDVFLPGFWLENKHGKKPNVRKALAQATVDSKKPKDGSLPRVPIAVIRDDRQEPFVVLYWKDFLDILQHLPYLKAPPEARPTRFYEFSMLPEEVDLALKNKINAIKVLRKRTGCSLKEAVDTIGRYLAPAKSAIEDD